jgi:hypothetical protein
MRYVGHGRSKICYNILVGNYGGRISVGSFKVGWKDLLKWILAK